MDGAIIDVRDQGTTELDQVDSRARKKAVFAFLQDNHLSEWVVVGRLGASLRVLDISNNLLTVLPEQSFWEHAVSLQFLYLHDNAITSLPSINDLAKLHSLIGLSLHGNPLASRPTYRRIVLAILPGIKMIDNYLVSDQERLRDAKMGEEFKPMGPAFCFPKFQAEFGVQLPECRRMLNAYVAGLNRSYARLSPIITIQTAVRNWIGRRHRPRIDRSLESMIDRISFLPQGDMVKEADEDDAETGSEASVEDPEREKARVATAAARQALMQQLASSVVLVGTDPLGVFHRMLTQVQTATSENSRNEGAKESLDFYKSVPLSLFLDTRGHMHAYHEDRTMEQSIAISSRWSRMLPCPMIRRRLCHVRTIDRNAFDRGCLYRNQAVYNDARRLHRFTLPDFVSRDMLLRLVENYNTGAQEPIVVFTYKMALAQWAALAIQSTWRSYKVRTVWLPSLSLARIFHRARNCIIHWWRYRLLRLRMEMLSGARRACEAVTSCDTIVTRRALELVLAAPSPVHRLGLFPEHRTVFDIVRLDENGAKSSSPRIEKPTCMVVHYVDPSTPTRALVPQWFQWNLSGLLEERPPTGAVSPFLEKARRLLQWDAVQDIQFETSSGHDGQKAQVLPDVENIAQWHIEFRTMEDARLRAFILYIGTWDPVSRSYCQLRPAVLQSGRFVPVGQEIEYPQAYREVPGKQAAEPEIDTDARQVEPGDITNSVNIRGVSTLNDQLERHLIEVDSEQLQMHNLDPALVGAQYVFDDDFVCLDDFVWSSESMWEYELDLQHRLDWQTQNLVVRSFDPAVVSDEDTARTPRDRNALMAQSTREQSQKLMEEKDRLESERYAEVREAMERMRDVHQIRVAINRATHRRVDSDHCQPEIESARSERDAMIQSRINRFKAQRRQFLKDQLVEKRINEVQQRNAKAIDKHTIAIARRAAQMAIEDRVKGLRQKYDAGVQQRSRRIKSIQHSMHFQRQIFQIAKHVAGAQLEENARQRQVQVTRDVQKRRIMDGRRRQYIHNTLLADFNRKRQNAIAQQLQIRDQIEQRRLEMQNNLGLLKAERHHIRAMREMIDEDIDACREDPVQALSGEGSGSDVHEHVRPRPNTQAALLQATDHELLDRISALEELADHVRQACTKAFIT